jgi:hypothetical protein
MNKAAVLVRNEMTKQSPLWSGGNVIEGYESGLELSWSEIATTAGGIS